MKKLSFRSSGFTLIEIMVVIAIIGILVSIVSVNFNEARQQSRDKVRMADLKEFQLALALYKSQNGRYPQMGCGDGGGGGTAWSGPDIPQPNGWSGFTCDEFILGLVPEFIPELPRDPAGGLGGYIYTVDANGTGYKLMANNENLRVTSFNNEFARCPSNCAGHCDVINDPNAQATYAVYAFSGECW